MNTKYVIKLVRPNGRDSAQTLRNVYVTAPSVGAASAAMDQKVADGKMSLYPGEFIGSISLMGYH